MDICGDIYDIFELKNIDVNDKIFDKILKKFLSNIPDCINFKDSLVTSTNKVLALKQQYVYTSQYTELFFKLLMNYNYNMRSEIKDAMFELGHLANPNKNINIIKKYLNSPVIQDIIFDGKSKFQIFSEKYGKLEFQLASYYYRNQKVMRDYIKTKELPRNCHNHTYFMSTIFPQYYSITSLCTYFFVNNYYHSYAYNNDDNVIVDLCYNSIVNKEQYYQIFQPNEISTILNSMVDEELALTNLKTEQFSNRCHLLKIALYKQYLKSIGYEGDLQSAPSVNNIKILNK